MLLSTRVDRVRHWLTPTVSTMLSKWVIGLLPANAERRRELIKAAALVGTTLDDKIEMGQVSHLSSAYLVSFQIKQLRTAEAFAEFGRECCMTSRASILRTAIMAGLRLPRVEFGVMSQTRNAPFEECEMFDIIATARDLFPQEMNNA